MKFNQYYFKEQNLTEINWLKTRFFGNALRALTGSGKRRVNPQDFKSFTQLTPAGYSEMFASLSSRYDKSGGTKVSGLKHFIKQAFTAIFDPQKAQHLFSYKDKDGSQKFVEFTKDPKSQVKAASYYVTNKGGRLMLVYLEDDNEVDRYYIGLDGNALKFFVAPVKQGGMGKDFRTWLAAQAASTYKPDQKTISPEFLGKGEKADDKQDIHKLTKIPITPGDYVKMAPKKESKDLNKSIHILNLFEDEILQEYDEKKKLKIQDGSENKVAITMKGNKWYLINKNGTVNGYEITSDSNEEALVQTDLVAVIEKPKGSKNWVKASDKTQEQLRQDIEKVQKSKTSSEKAAIKDKGELYNDVKDEIEGEPASVKPDENQQKGWRYNLKNKGVLFIYQNIKDKKYYLSYNAPAKKKADELISKYNLERGPETPTEGYTIWDYLNTII